MVLYTNARGRKMNAAKKTAAWSTNHKSDAYLGWGNGSVLHSVSPAPSLLLQLGHVRKFILVGNNNYCALRANAASDVAVVRFNHCANGTLIGGLRGKTDLLVLRATDRSHMPGITKDGRQLECTAKGAGVPASVYVVAGTLPRTVSLPNTTVVEQFTRSRHERFCYQRSFLNKSTGRSCSTGVEAYALLKHLFPRAIIALQGFDGHKEKFTAHHDFHMEQALFARHGVVSVCNETDEELAHILA